MIRYSCDCCKRDLDPEMDVRYVVNVEAYAACEPPLEGDEAGGDRDHLQEIQEVIAALENSIDEPTGEDVYRQMKYDLCAECHRRFVRNPLGREVASPFQFSNN